MPFWSSILRARRPPAAAGRRIPPKEPGDAVTLCIEPVPPYRATLSLPCGTTKLLTTAEAWELLVGETVSRVHREQFVIPLR